MVFITHSENILCRSIEIAIDCIARNEQRQEDCLWRSENINLLFFFLLETIVRELKHPSKIIRQTKENDDFFAYLANNITLQNNNRLCCSSDESHDSGETRRTKEYFFNLHKYKLFIEKNCRILRIIIILQINFISHWSLTTVKTNGIKKESTNYISCWICYKWNSYLLNTLWITMKTILWLNWRLLSSI